MRRRILRGRARLAPPRPHVPVRARRSHRFI